MREILKRTLQTIFVLVMVGVVIYCATTSGYGWLIILFLLWKLTTLGLKIIGIVFSSCFGILITGIKIVAILFVLVFIWK